MTDVDPTNAPLLSRADFHRMEIGPVVNYMTLSVIDATPSFMFYPHMPEMSIFDIARLACRAAYTFDTTLLSMTGRWGSFESVSRLLRPPNYPLEATYYGTIDRVLDEGIKSGVTMPLLAALECFSDAGYGHFVPRDDFVTMLRDKHFQAALLKLSHCPNGTYGANSSKPNISNHNLISQKLESSPVFEGLKLTSAVSERLETVRQNCEEFSSGCPVRYFAYPEIGPFAQAFAEEEGIDIDTLRRPRTSAIVASAEFLATVLDSYFKDI